MSLAAHARSQTQLLRHTNTSGTQSATAHCLAYHLRAFLHGKRCDVLAASQMMRTHCTRLGMPQSPPMPQQSAGDHFGFSYTKGRASIFPRYNRHGRKLQVENVEKLLQFDFEHVLPGHGRRFFVHDAQERRQALEETKLDAGMAVA